MLNKSKLSTLIRLHIVRPSLIFLLFTGSAQAQTSPVDYVFLLASGFLCQSGDSGNCPAVAKSANGDTYEISGAGTFASWKKSVQAVGTFNHKAKDGTVLETGAWLASELISFGSYGIAPNALQQRGPAYAGPGLGPKRMSTRAGAMPTGGLAIFRIVLVPFSGPSKTAVLQMNCALGDVPRERSVEGIRLTFETGGNEFPEEMGGRVLFLSMRFKVSPPARAEEQEAAPGRAELPHN
ncbi:MAG TPA: hypothetical protein VMI32_13620 [Candidatus Solibacter sp.]|nr:hypothetical protein [Candidatus Solibacter sp.]